LLVDTGRLAPPVGETFRWASARDALMFAASGKGLAKTIVLGP
jgi:hypothetical protein